MLKTAFVFAALLVAMAQATIMDASFKVGDKGLHGAVVSGRVHITVPTRAVGEAFDWLLDGHVWRRDAGNGVMADVRSGVNTFAFADGKNTLAIRSPVSRTTSNVATFHVDNTRTSMKTVDASSSTTTTPSTPATVAAALVRHFDTAGFLKGKKKKKKKKTANNGGSANGEITGYDQYGNPIYGSSSGTASDWHNENYGSSNLGLNNGQFGNHGGFDLAHPGPTMQPAGQDFSQHAFDPNGNGNVGFGNNGNNNFNTENGFNGGFDNGSGFGNDGGAFGGGSFGAATTVLNPATGQTVTISDSTLQNCRNMGMNYFSVTTGSCTNEQFTNGQQNTVVGSATNGNDWSNNGGTFGGNTGSTREGEPECTDATETCVQSVCLQTAGMTNNSNLAPGLIAPGVMAQCTNGGSCTSFTDPSDHTCPRNYRPCCENPGFSRTTWIVIGVGAAAFVLIVVVAVSIRARNIGRSAELGNMRSLMTNMDSSDSSIFLSNSIQRNPARY